MNHRRTAYYYMTPEEKKEYHLRKHREYYARKMALLGRTVNHHTPGSHPTKMSPEERLEYNRQQQRRYKEKHRYE